VRYDSEIFDGLDVVQARYAFAITAAGRHAGPSREPSDTKVLCGTRSNQEAGRAYPSPAGYSSAVVRTRSPTRALRQRSMAKGEYCVTDWSAAAGTVMSASTTGNCAYAVPDPRRNALGSGAIGAIPWAEHGGTIAGESLPSNGAFAVVGP
jgi:hypothetical protein